MHEACVTYPDKTDKKKTIREKSLNCHRCWQSVPLTADLQAIYDELTAGRNVEVFNVSKRIQGFALSNSISAAATAATGATIEPDQPVRNPNISDYNSNATLVA